MSVTFKGYSKEVLAALSEAIDQGLETIGDRAQGYAQNLAPVDTGNLRASIIHRKEGKHTEVVGTSDEAAPYKKVDYAQYVELGTSRMGAQPFLRPAAENHREEYVRIMRDALNS